MKLIVIIIGGLVLILSVPRQLSYADELILPATLTTIEEEAFADSNFSGSLTIPETMIMIKAGAFRNCSGLKQMVILNDSISLGESFLEGCAEDLLIVANPGSAAYMYAAANQIDYRCGTVCRALLIAQTYDGIADLELDGPVNDIAELKAGLSVFQGTPYRISSRINLSANGILSAIRESFSDAEEQDISLLYYSGHGVAVKDTAVRGALLAKDGVSYVTADQLRIAMDTVPGRKIIVVDACYSGNLLEATSTNNNNQMSIAGQYPETGDQGSDSGAAVFASSFVSAFSRKNRGNLSGDNYYVLTAAASDEKSYEGEIGGKIMGLFSARMIMGMGGLNMDSVPADQNGNGVITFQEMYNYTRKYMVYDMQHVQGYPTNCNWFGILRNQ